MEVGHWVDRAGRSVDVIAANENEVKSHSLDQILDWTLTAARAAHGDDYHSEASDVMSVLIRDENNGVRAAFVHPGMWEVMVTALNITDIE